MSSRKKETSTEYYARKNSASKILGYASKSGSRGSSYNSSGSSSTSSSNSSSSNSSTSSSSGSQSAYEKYGIMPSEH